MNNSENCENKELKFTCQVNDEPENLHSEFLEKDSKNSRQGRLKKRILKKEKRKTLKKYRKVLFLMSIPALMYFSYACGKNTIRFKHGPIDSLEKFSNVSSVEVEIDNGTKLSTTEIAKKVGPSVVGISTKINKNMGFFGVVEGEATGSGIIISRDGYILTNNHVVEKSDEMLVILSTSKEYKAKLVGRDERTDLAIIKIEPKEELVPAVFGDSSVIQVGETVVAIGNPLGLEFRGSVTRGIVSGVNREISKTKLQVIQTDAAINSGNSGGPLINKRGEIIGVNVAKVAFPSEAERMGFAIPINIAKPVIKDLIDHGYVKGRPTIGIAARNVGKDIAKQQGWPMGIQVISVSPGSGAEIADLNRGDIITECNGKKVMTVDELNKIKDEMSPGDKIVLQVYKYDTGLNKSVTVKLSEEKVDTAK